MKIKLLITILFIITQSFYCISSDVKEEDPDEILEEELRAETEPIKEIKERDFKEEVKKPLKKR
jgi:hypothetical protein